jgi:hypothetical protein
VKPDNGWDEAAGRDYDFLQRLGDGVPNKAFFLATLLLPILVGYLGYFIPALDGIYFIWQFAAIPYFISAGVLVLLICFARTRSQLAVISLCAPVLMSAFEWAFLVAIDPPELRSFHRVLQLASVVPMAVAVAFVFVALSWAAFAALRKFGWVASEPRN